jgi:hypothetical protein
MAHRQRLWEAEPGCPHGRGVEIGGRENASSHRRLTEKHGLRTGGGEPHRTGGGRSERELTCERRDTNDSLRSSWTQAEAGAGREVAPIGGIGW